MNPRHFFWWLACLFTYDVARFDREAPTRGIPTETRTRLRDTILLAQKSNANPKPLTLVTAVVALIVLAASIATLVSP